MGPGWPRGWALLAALGALGLGLRAAAAAVGEERRSASSTPSTPCWQLEDFVVAQECGRCSSFQAKTVPECGPTGFVERISCAASKRDEFKRWARGRGDMDGAALGPFPPLSSSFYFLLLLPLPAAAARRCWRLTSSGGS
uniref:Protein JTB n=1 Tax=Anas platyrhynchos platyrhynchos TaxID=8840 RepID=A0A493TTN2_ANAPP